MYTSSSVQSVQSFLILHETVIKGYHHQSSSLFNENYWWLCWVSSRNMDIQIGNLISIQLGFKFWLEILSLSGMQSINCKCCKAISVLQGLICIRWLQISLKPQRWMALNKWGIRRGGEGNGIENQDHSCRFLAGKAFWKENPYNLALNGNQEKWAQNL